MLRTFYLVSFLYLINSIAIASINISIEYTESAYIDFSDSDKSLFQSAVDFWGNIITGYQDNVDRDWKLTVDSFSEAAANGGITVGAATGSGYGISEFVPNSNYSHGRFIFTTGGYALFNTHSDVGNLSETVIRHEVGHALGIGILWEANEVYNDGDASNNLSYLYENGNYERYLVGGTPGQYKGEAGLRAYRNEFDPNATFIPVELDGSSATANGHWNEVADNPLLENTPGFDSDPGDGNPAPIVTSGPNSGKSLDDELMTGVSSNDSFISITTIASLEDIGFTIPEQKTYALVLGCFAIFAGIRKKLNKTKH
jgi:hypothetical protein